MIPKETLDYLKSQLHDYMTRAGMTSKGKNKFVCPFCESGRNGGTGAFHVDVGATQGYCFSCGASADVFKAIGKLEGVNTFTEQVRRATELYGACGTSYAPSQTRTGSRELSPPPQSDRLDLFFLSAHEAISTTEYHRGLTRQTLNRFKIGYVSEWRYNDSRITSPRLIIPVSPWTYTARDTREAATLPEVQRRYIKLHISSGGNYAFKWTFNHKAFTRTDKPLFVTEGELDALSIIDCGFEAVATGSACYTRQLAALVRNLKARNRLIMAFDADEAGERAAQSLKRELLANSFTNYTITNTSSLYFGNKDANEAMNNDRERLTSRLQAAYTVAN